MLGNAAAENTLERVVQVFGQSDTGSNRIELRTPLISQLIPGTNMYAQVRQLIIPNSWVTISRQAYFVAILMRFESLFDIADDENAMIHEYIIQVFFPTQNFTP